MRPRSAKTNPALLIHGECSQCGWMMAAPEGSKWPLCPECEGFVFPPSKGREGYVAIRLPEQQAVRIVVGGRQDHVRELRELALAVSPLIDKKYGPKVRRRDRARYLEHVIAMRDRMMELVRQAY